MLLVGSPICLFSSLIGSDLERKVDILDAVPNVKGPVNLRISAGVGKTAGPEARLEQNNLWVGLVSLDRPSVWSACRCVVQEITAKDVFFSGCQANFFRLRLRSHVHEWLKRAEIVKFKTSESFIFLNFAKIILEVGADRNKWTALVNLSNDTAESVKLWQSLGREFAQIAPFGVEGDQIGVALTVNENSLGLAQEERLELVEQRFEVSLGGREERKLPRAVLAPEEFAFREVFLSRCVCANRNKVVRFNSCAKKTPKPF